MPTLKNKQIKLRNFSSYRPKHDSYVCILFVMCKTLCFDKSGCRFKYKPGNRRYHTSPTVCNLTPSPSRPIILVQRLQSSICPWLVHAAAWTVQFAIHRGVRLVGHMFSASPLEIVSPTQHIVPRAKPTHHPKRHRDSAVFVWVPNAMLYNALSMGKNSPKLSLPLGFRHPAEPRHAPKIWERSRVCRVVPEMSSRTDRETVRHTHRHTHYSTLQNTNTDFVDRFYFSCTQCGMPEKPIWRQTKPPHK